MNVADLLCVDRIFASFFILAGVGSVAPDAVVGAEAVLGEMLVLVAVDLWLVVAGPSGQPGDSSRLDGPGNDGLRVSNDSRVCVSHADGRGDDGGGEPEGSQD
ncbi:unnamed protein product [Clonostachys byssicola]|uniref:Uncharacterized protein n=1 Tax=Clonostachys byssicola TaxID=160290 RepID=A0A9N9UM67_9HYPO|nr:unnamed protein product [Clonostachys byssicola]